MKDLNKKDLINGGEGYKDFSDFVVLTDKKPFDTNILRKDGIIFCKTDYLDFLFSNIRFSARKYILITHFSDISIDERRFLSRPGCIKKWYAWSISYKHNDLIPIPVGYGVHYDKDQNVRYDYLSWFLNNLDRLKSVPKDNETVYCNFSIDNLRPPRQHVIPSMVANGVPCFEPVHQHVYDGRMFYPDYCESMARYKFVASPNGNGRDAHRTWEALYMNCIPITQTHPYRNFNLPILEVRDYQDVTPKLLKDFLEFCKTHQFDYEKLDLSYWEGLMRNDLKTFTT